MDVFTSDEIYEDLTSQIVSGISFFTLSNIVIEDSLKVYFNGIRQRDDYFDLKSNNYQFETAFVTVVGDELFVDYEIVSSGLDVATITDSFEVKVSTNDTVENFLENKIISGNNISITVLNEGGNEQLEISSPTGTFLSLSDTPDSYINNAGKLPVVTSGEIALEFTYNIGDENIDGQGMFLMACHQSADERAYLMASDDGKDWSLLKKSLILVPTSGNQRDPTLFKFNDNYYIAHTNSTNKHFTILESENLAEWTYHKDVNMGNIPALNLVWAPQWFVDDDGIPHIFTACSTSGVTTNFQIYETHPLVPTTLNGLWSSPAFVPITGENNVIDPFVIKKNGTYYLWYKEEDTDYIQYASSLSLLGTYTNVETGDWAGWGTPREAPVLVKIDTDTWRMYLNEHSGLDSVAIYWSESSDNWATWTTPVAITSPWIVAHPDILRVRDITIARNILSVFLQDSKTLGCAVKRTSAQTISNTTTTAIQF